METQKLYKSQKNRIIWGIIGGIGEYFNIDPTVLRLAYIILILITGIFPGIIAYIIAYFIIPESPENLTKEPLFSTEDSKTPVAEQSSLRDEPKKPQWPQSQNATPKMEQSVPEANPVKPEQALLIGRSEQIPEKELEKEPETLDVIENRNIDLDDLIDE